MKIAIIIFTQWMQDANAIAKHAQLQRLTTILNNWMTKINILSCQPRVTVT